MAETPKKPPTTAAKPVAAKPAAAKKPVVAKKPVAVVKKPVTATPVAAIPPAPAAKPAKVKMVRQSYSMPETNRALLSELKKHCQQNGTKIKKGELLSAGLSLLAKLSPADLAKLLQAA